MSSMSQSRHQDPESGNGVEMVDTGGHPDRRQSTRDSSCHNLESGNGSDVHHGSWPLYVMYSKITQETDKRQVKSIQQHIDGLLVFTGLFSATVATLLSVTIPDLKPNSQDTSAFYLGNIYELLANPNGSNGSIPSTLAQPPPFSPQKYVIWVNSLWLLALLIGLSGALLMMLTKSFVLRSISITQNEEYSPEMRARLSAQLSHAESTFIFRDSNHLPFFLHLSLFLFMAGLLIYFFNINRTTFYALVWWIAITTILYVRYTIFPFFHSSLVHTPFSPLVFCLYLVFAYVASQVGSWIESLRHRPDRSRNHYRDLSGRYRRGFFAVEKEWAEEAASKPSSDIDAEVLLRTLVVLDEDHALESFFDAIPGFCNSKLVQKPLDLWVTTELQRSLDGFLDRTFSSQLVTELARNNRVIICLNAAYSALGPSAVSQILGNFFNGCRDEALQSVELGYALIRWGHSSDYLIYPKVRRIVACIVPRAQDRNDHWVILVKKVFEVPEEVIRDHLAHGDGMLLAILLHVARKTLDTDRLERGVLESLSQFDIRDTPAGLRHDFCALWNQIVQEARNKEIRSTPIRILNKIRRISTTLHQGTDSAPVRFPAPIGDDDHVLSWPWSYRLCNIASHHPDNPATTSPTVPPPIQLGDSQNAPLLPPLPSRLPLTASRELATKNAIVGNADISVTAASGIANLPVRSSDFGSSSTLQQAEEARTMPHPFVLGSLPTPIPSPAVHSANSIAFPPSIDTALLQTEHVHHSLGAPSSTSTTIPLSIIPQAATVSSKYPDIHDGTTSAQYNNRDTHLRIQSEDHRASPPGGATGL